MAKKTSAKPAKAPSAKQPATKKPATKKPATKKPAAKEPKLETGRSFTPDESAAHPVGLNSTEEIGHVAGDVWGILTRDGAQTIAAIKRASAAPDDLVSAAIGWLAREDKLDFITEGRTTKISLRPEE